MIDREKQMRFGSRLSESFIRDLSDKEFRDEYVADQIRTRIALLIRALREQPDRSWSQAQLGKEMDKPQSVVSRIEDPDYGKLSIQTLLDVVSAFDLPLWIDIPEWHDWLQMIRNVPNSSTHRVSFDPGQLMSACHAGSVSSSTFTAVQPRTHTTNLHAFGWVEPLIVCGGHGDTANSQPEIKVAQ